MLGPVLGEGHDTQQVRPPHRSLVRRQFAAQDLEQGGLPAAVRSNQADADAGRKRQVQILEQPASAERLSDAFGLNQPLGLSIGCAEIDFRRGRAVARRRSRRSARAPATGCHLGEEPGTSGATETSAEIKDYVIV
jgi:hypothetical protein